MTDVPVFILAGQSNAEYAGIDNRIVERLMALGGAFEFVKRAVGGVSLFPNPNAPDWAPTSTGDLFSLLVADILAAAANVRAQGHNPVFTILWVQGEYDRNNPSYGSQLTAFIAALRTAVAAPEMEFYISALPYASAARTGQLAVAAADPHAHLVETMGAGFWDGVHYDRATRDRIANDFMDAAAPTVPTIAGYQNLLAGQTGFQNGAYWEVQLPAYIDANFTSDDRHHRVFAGNGDDRITTGAGNDGIWAGGNDDIVFSGAGNDFIDLGHHNDIGYGGTGNDTIRGQSGSDVLYGEDGDDTLDGGEQDDRLFGGAGDDMLTGGTGDDFISGGEGWDVLTVSGARSAYRLLYTADGGFILKGPDGLDRITGVEVIRFSDGLEFDTARACGQEGVWFDLSDLDDVPPVMPSVDVTAHFEESQVARSAEVLLRPMAEFHADGFEMPVDHLPDPWFA